MKCSYCNRQLTAEAPQVVLVINGDSAQAYCGSPASDSVDGLSCWQHAIESWHSLIALQEAAPHISLEESTRRVLRVRRSTADGQPYAEAHVKLSPDQQGTMISRKRHRVHA